MMKKIISLGLGLVLMLSCVVLPVSAATLSPEVKDVISGIEAYEADGTRIYMDLIKADKIDEDLKPTADDEKLVTQTTVKIEEDAKYPVTVIVNMAGIKPTSKVYVLAKDPTGKVEKINVTIKKAGVISFILDRYYSSLSFVTDLNTATQIGTSDKTADAVMPYVALVMLVSAAAIAISKKKITE